MTCKELEHYFDELYICSIGFQLHISLVDFSDFTFIRKLYALVAEGTFDPPYVPSATSQFHALPKVYLVMVYSLKCVLLQWVST